MTEEKKEEIKIDDALDIKSAIESLDKTGKKSEFDTDSKEKKIEIPGIDKFKNNEVAVTVNKFLTKNIDDDAGDCYFGENVARTGEFYGMKSHPLIALGLSALFVVILLVKKVLKLDKKKKQEET